MHELAFRAAAPADAEDLARAVVDGVEDYRSFAPPGWTPPSLEGEIEHLHAVLGDEHVWCLLAEAGGELVGQVTVLPAARAARPVHDPALAHLSNIFVRRDRWGTGLAKVLHAAAIEAARERGFTEMRLLRRGGPGSCEAVLRARGMGAGGRRVPRSRPEPGADRVPAPAARPAGLASPNVNPAGWGVVDSGRAEGAWRLYRG